MWESRGIPHEVAENNVLDWASSVPAMLMDDASWQNQLLLQYISRTPTPWVIDREVGDLAGDLLGSEPAMTYLRYNAWLERTELEKLGLHTIKDRAVQLREMSAAENREDLARVGEAAAAWHVLDEHFPDAFNLPK